MSSPIDDVSVRVRISEAIPRLFQVGFAIVAFFAVTMLSDIRGELRGLADTLQELLVRTAGIEQRVVVLEGATRDNRTRLDRQDENVRQFWRDYGPALRQR